MAALRAPGGRMQGAAAQAMSVHIVEPPQRRPRPTYAACGGNGGWARRPPGLAAPEARYRGPGSAATRRAHGSCWALPSSVGRGLHGPECWALPSSVGRRLHGPECWALPSSVGRGLHGPECWALPSSVGRRLHGPECGRYRRCSASLTRAPALGTIHTGIAFVVAPCARLTSTDRSGRSLVPER